MARRRSFKHSTQIVSLLVGFLFDDGVAVVGLVCVGAGGGAPLGRSLESLIGHAYVPVVGSSATAEGYMLLVSLLCAKEEISFVRAL
jgi:hypothetical protein